jgi:hypothetical protein
MVSSCRLLFDQWEICEQKASIPDDLCALFQETDRRAIDLNGPIRSGDVPRVAYEAPRETVL